MTGFPPPEGEFADDALARRLRRLAEDLERDLGDAVRVERNPIFCGEVSLIPTRGDALGVAWIDFGIELRVDTASGLGGQFELARTQEDVDFLEGLVRSVVAGRVVEVFAANRSRVTITMADGTTEVETGYDGLSGCLPLPGWPRRGRTVRYAPYRPTEHGR